MSCGVESSPTIATASRNIISKGGKNKAPLRSVENQLPEKKATQIMNGNNNCDTSTKIRTEPFTDHYTVEEEIGRGKFAVVKRCRHKVNGLEYAAKFLRKRRKGKDARGDILHEIVMLETARPNPRLVDLVEVFETSHEIIIVTQYAAGGELYQSVVVEESLSEPDTIRLMRQLLEGLVFLHDRNIVHLDVKPQNVLLTAPHPHGDIKLCDFGFARTINSGEDVRDIIGTPDYVAPEVLSYEPIHTAADMWSVGCLAYVLLTGYSPFAGDTKQETFLNISQVNIDFPDDLFEGISSDAKDLIMKLLVKEPEERSTARDALQHTWFTNSECSSSSSRPPAVDMPIGSPTGYRRALSHGSPNSSMEREEPSKRCKCDEEEGEKEREKEEVEERERGEAQDADCNNCGSASQGNQATPGRPAPSVSPASSQLGVVMTTTASAELTMVMRENSLNVASTSSATCDSEAMVTEATIHIDNTTQLPMKERSSNRGNCSNNTANEKIINRDKNCISQLA